MSNYVVNGESLSAVADALRAKAGLPNGSGISFPNGFINIINSLSEENETEPSIQYTLFGSYLLKFEASYYYQGPAIEMNFSEEDGVYSFFSCSVDGETIAEYYNVSKMIAAERFEIHPPSRVPLANVKVIEGEFSDFGPPTNISVYVIDFLRPITVSKEFYNIFTSLVEMYPYSGTPYFAGYTVAVEKLTNDNEAPTGMSSFWVINQLSETTVLVNGKQCLPENAIETYRETDLECIQATIIGTEVPHIYFSDGEIFQEAGVLMEMVSEDNGVRFYLISVPRDSNWLDLGFFPDAIT